METPDELILRCGSDPEALRALIEQFRMRIYSFILHLAGRDPADDLFQEVWLRVYKNAPGFEARGKAASWIFRIANNVCLNHLEKTGRRHRLEQAGPELPERPDPRPGPLAALEQEEVRRRLDSAVEALPFEQRQVFLMREFGRMPFKDVAEALEVPLGTALSRMSAALAKLRASLEDIRA